MRPQVDAGGLDFQPIAGLALDAVLNDVGEQASGDSDRKHARDQDDHDGEADAENFQKTHRKSMISKQNGEEGRRPAPARASLVPRPDQSKLALWRPDYVTSVTVRQA